MEESDSDSSDYMSSIDVFDSEVSNSGCEEYYSCDEGDDNEAQPLKLRCVICKKGVASDGELRKHTEAEENHANIRSRIGFKCLSDLAHVCFQASIANAARESQLQNEQAISQVESVDSANNAGEKENGSSSDAMHPDSPSINTEDEEDADDEEEQVQPSTSAGLGTGRILSRDTKSSTNNEEDSDKDGDSAEDLENNGDHDDDDANGMYVAEKPYTCNVSTNVFYSTPEDDNLELQPRKVTEDNHEWNCESQTHPLIPSTTPEVHLVLIGDNAEEKENGSSSDILHPDSPSTNTDDEEDDEEEQVLPSTSATLEKGRIIFMDSQSNTNNQVDNDQDGDRAEDLENGEYDDDHAYAKKPYTSNISTNVLYSTPVDDNVELQPRNANDDHHEWNCESQTHPLSPSTTPEVYLVLMPNHTEEIEVRPPSIRVPELTSYNAEKEQPSTSAGVEAGGMIAAHSQSKTNNAEDNEEDNDGARGGEDLEDGDHDDNDELGN
ncbi:unnamed protein product [Orchesella dallaii]|uniref:C2H2-type domain-containing protein n=1 Tax=Orchesella dallaii TaxID=48710 RepID=A0ABP1RMU7_9HEXA